MPPARRYAGPRRPAGCKTHCMVWTMDPIAVEPLRFRCAHCSFVGGSREWAAGEELLSRQVKRSQHQHELCCARMNGRS